MDLYPLPADQAMRQDPVETGWTRVIRHGPMTVEQVLERGRAAMEAEDEREAREADPVAWLRAERRRRRLWDRLFGRC
jgi:hypothetical protein